MIFRVSVETIPRKFVVTVMVAPKYVFTIGLESVAIDIKDAFVLAAETVPSNLLNLKSKTCASKTLGKTR